MVFKLDGNHMVNEKLQSIGQKLNVSGQDIKNIQNTAIKEKLTRFFIHPILRAVLLLILSILTFIVGISLGGGCTNCVGYPYYAATGLAITPRKRKGSIPIVTVIAGLLIPIVTFMTGYLVGRTFFSYAIMYSIYKRDQKNS